MIALWRSSQCYNLSVSYLLLPSKVLFIGWLMDLYLRELNSQLTTNMGSGPLYCGSVSFGLIVSIVALRYFLGISERAFDSFNISCNCFFITYLLRYKLFDSVLGRPTSDQYRSSSSYFCIFIFFNNIFSCDDRW